MVRGYVGFALLALVSVLTTQALASNVYVVTDPADLQMVDLEEGYRYVSSEFASRFDILNPIRRVAARKMVKGWGLKEMPDKARVYLGVVANTDPGTLEFAVVIKGDALDCQKLKARLIEKYGNHWRRHKLESKPKSATIGGVEATVLPYIQRKGELVIVIAEGQLIFGSVVPGHYDLIERTVQVVRDPSRKRPQPPASTHVSAKGTLSPEERTRVKEFFQRTVTGRVDKFRKGFERLYKKLDSEEFNPQEFKTINEKLNDIFLKHTGYTLDLQYKGGSDGNGTYKLVYTLTFPSPQEAQDAKELLLEKVLFYKENSQAKAGVLAMDAVALDASGPTVTVTAEADSKKGVYNFYFAYLAFLLGYSQTDRYLVAN
ncbi:MAG: hypothetical protein HY815_14255 [Candidatus Riflebacteria bacterium]|nr:hypothetical protein [Candidatus Riflebacteria bacterium]